MPAPDLPPSPRKRSWAAFALVGFVAGLVTVILLLVLVRRLRGG
jgi:hypothetical protein